ncbi:MAG: hypothetical protein WAN75_46720, partial [Xanthobacteraceae bacterium]
MEFRGCPKAIPSGLGKRCAVAAAYEQTSGGSPQGAAVTCPGEIDVSAVNLAKTCADYWAACAEGACGPFCR